MGHAIKDFEKSRASWKTAFHLAHYNRRCTCGLRFAMSNSKYCGLCWRRHKSSGLLYTFGTGRLAVVEPTESTPRVSTADGMKILNQEWEKVLRKEGPRPEGVECHEGFTVPAGFAALGE